MLSREKTLERKLKEIKLINDEKFAYAYFQDRINLSNDGPYKIKQELINNNISESVIEEIYSKMDQEIIYQKLDKLIQKKIKIMLIMTLIIYLIIFI